MKEYKFVWQ